MKKFFTIAAILCSAACFNAQSQIVVSQFGQIEMGPENSFASFPMAQYDSITTLRVYGPGQYITISSPSQSKRITVYSTGCTITDVDPNSNIMINNRKFIPHIEPLLLQNCIYNESGYMITDRFIAGNHVDSNRTYGDVTIPTGTMCEVEILKDARFYPGFKVEQGSVFKILPSTADIYGKRISY